VAPIGSGSDHTVFLNLVCAPALDMTFEGDYGVYHSAYDSYRWMTLYGDPGLRYMTRMGEVWGRMAMRLAGAEVVPLDYAEYGRQIGGFVAGLEEKAPAESEGKASWAPGLRRAAGRLSRAGEEVRAVQRDARRLEALGEGGQEALNRRLLQAERDLCDGRGLPDRPWFKHLIYACRYTYAALTLPGLTEAVERGDARRSRERARLLRRALGRAARTLR
jgi:N-acetylated-alpha-linked acidic dipeptidase